MMVPVVLEAGAIMVLVTTNRLALATTTAPEATMDRVLGPATAALMASDLARWASQAGRCAGRRNQQRLASAGLFHRIQVASATRTPCREALVKLFRLTNAPVYATGFIMPVGAVR